MPHPADDRPDDQRRHAGGPVRWFHVVRTTPPRGVRTYLVSGDQRLALAYFGATLQPGERLDVTDTPAR